MRPEDDFTPPRFDTHPDAAWTMGSAVAELCERVGYAPDVHQRLILDRVFARNLDDRLVSPEACVICPRQNLKSAVLKMCALGWLFVDPVELITWSAHELPTAKEMFRDLKGMILDTPELRARLKHGRNEGISEANGNIGIELAPDPARRFRDGQRILFKARTLDGGRGLSGDRVVLDEAFALQPEHMGAMIPTLSARPDAHVVYASSAGKANSAPLRQIRDRGRQGGSDTLTYVEWCTWREQCESETCDHHKGTPGCLLDDPVELKHANPSTGTWHQIGGVWVPALQPEILAMERESMPPEIYLRERLGIWDDPQEGDPVLSGDLWSQLAIEAEPWDPVTLALDVAPDRSWSCVVGAGLLADGRTVVEVTGDPATGRADYREGTGWVKKRILAIRARFPDLHVAISGGSAAESLRPALEEAEIPVDVVAWRDVQAACGLFVDLARDRKLAHLGQPALTQALMSARLKNTEQGFRWARRRSAEDIAPLYAATVAAWQVHQGAPEDPDGQFWSWEELVES